jgi:hypothetical protein
MNTFPNQISKRASKGAALLIVLAFVVLLTGLAVAYFSRTTTDRQLAQSSFNDTTADLLARSALDIVVGDLKQERASAPSVPTSANIQPQRSGDDASIPNLIRRSVRNDAIPAPGVPSLASAVSSAAASANGRSISAARWNSHYLIPRRPPNPGETWNTIYSDPVSTFTAPDWVLVTAQGPSPAPLPSAVIGRYAFAVYDEGGLLDMNLAGYPIYASQISPSGTRLARDRGEANEIIRVAGGGPPPNIQGNMNQSGNVGVAFTYQINATHNPTSYGASGLPTGLAINTSTGLISGTPTFDGVFSVDLSATNGSGTDIKTLNLTINVLATGGPTPWPVNIARKGIVALTDLRGLRSPNGSSLTSSDINKLMGWRNYATTQQPSSATFDTPSFPLVAATEDLYADYFLDFGSVQAPFITRPFTTVSATTTSLPSRTDQGLMTRQELLQLRRTIGFSQNLLQYMGTFSRERNQTAPVWPRFNLSKLPDRWDITNFGLILPDPEGTKVHGKGRGAWRKTPIGNAFGLLWVDGIDVDPDTGLPVPNTDPRYYGHWKYIGKPGFNNGSTQAARHIPAFRGAPPADFFQILNYALTRANIPDWDPDVDDPDNTHILRALSVGAAIINQYQTADLVDPKSGTRTTIIEYAKEDDGSPLYAYGMANEDPLRRPPAAPPPPVNYVFLNRRFENIGEFGYAYDLASTTASHTLNFQTSASNDKPILDFFTYNPVDHTRPRAGVVNLNTKNAPVLATIITGALLNDPGGETVPTSLVTQSQADAAGQAIVNATSAVGGAALTRADVARLAEVAANAVPGLAASDEARETITRVLAEVGQTRTWNLMIDVIAQTGKYAPGTASITDSSKFAVEGEKRYWLHIAIDRYDGTVLGQQLEEVTE